MRAARASFEERKTLLRALAEALDADPLDAELVQGFLDQAEALGLAKEPKVAAAAAPARIHCVLSPFTQLLVSLLIK
jgi:hypothetical protein